ncbi:MAG: hypothetical protein ACRD3R_10315 [Terriglobales bacterium]
MTSEHLEHLDSTEEDGDRRQPPGRHSEVIRGAFEPEVGVGELTRNAHLTGM